MSCVTWNISAGTGLKENIDCVHDISQEKARLVQVPVADE